MHLCTVAVICALVVWSQGPSTETTPTSDAIRKVASKLKAAGALEAAAEQYGRWVQENPNHPDKGTIAFSVAGIYLELGQFETALRWYFEAEVAGVGELKDELARKQVHTLERLGRVHAARAVLSGTTELNAATIQRPENDAVVAQIGEQKIYRSQLQRSLDDMPPEFAKALSGAENAPKLLQKFVADELLWRKAQKLEYEKKPEVQRRLAQMHKQLVVGQFVEQELVGTIAVDETDLENFFAARKAMFKKGDQEPTLKEVRPAVEQAYRFTKIQAAYQAAITEEMSLGDVQLFPERLAP